MIGLGNRHEFDAVLVAELIVGGHDQILAALGAGAWESGDVSNGMGTVDCITAIMPAKNNRYSITVFINSAAEEAPATPVL